MREFECCPLTSRSNLLGFDMALCLGHISCTWVYHHKMMCHIHSWPLHDLDLWLQYQNYICFWTRSFLDWCRHTKFSTWVLHHETTCVQSYPVYDVDLWPTCTCRWQGVSVVSFTQRHILRVCVTFWFSKSCMYIHLAVLEIIWVPNYTTGSLFKLADISEFWY